MGKKRHSIDVLFMFVLFAVFAILSVLIILIGSGVYNRTSENKQMNEQTRTVLSYITNKVRETDGSDNVFLTQKQGEQVLVLRQQYDGYGLDTWVYEYGGHLMEMTVDSGDEFELKYGERLLSISDIVFDMDGTADILRVEAKDESGDISRVSIYLGDSER